MNNTAHINRQNEQQQHNLSASYLHVPTVDDLAFQDGNFLALNVPVDENVYYTGEQQMAQQNHYQDAQNAGTSTTFMEVGPQDGNAAEAQSVGAFPGNVQAEPQGNASGKCQYMDCPPTTNLVQLKPFAEQQRELHEIHYQEQQQAWRHEATGQSHFESYQPRSHGQQFLPENGKKIK